MPELPEVETVRAGLSRLITHKSIKSVTYDWAKSFPNAHADVDQFLVGSTISQVRRRAKVLIVDLSTGYSLITHLKMTGQMVFVPTDQVSSTKFQVPSIDRSTKIEESHDSNDGRFGAGHPNASLIGSLPDKSTRVIIEFHDRSHLYFNDQRKFGWMKLVPTHMINEMDFFKKLGPEPLEVGFTASVFKERLLKRKNSTIKAALLDQSTLAGIGNIYADEALWGARIHPESLVKDLTQKQITDLHADIIYVLKLSIEKGGSTDRNYVNAEGKKGSYIQFARVFRRENLPCSRCQTTIMKTRVAGRGTHICPTCQTK